MTVKKGGLSARDRPAIEDDPVFRALDAGDRAAILELGETFRFSFQDLKQLVTITADYRMWGMGGLRGSWPGGLRPAGPDPRREGRRELRLLEDEWRRMKAEPIVYDKSPARERPKKLTYVRHEAPGPVLGRCPVASSKTRCCNLLTLDAVMNCGFGCSYCSIQTFHETGEIMVRSDLKAKLDEIVLDPREIYHIGTGQASDSLLYGNRFSLLGTLFDFARKNRNVILELKTKSANSGGLVKASPPPNVIATWTLNTQRVIANEEHFTAALDERLSAARKAADHGVLVGFHFHPIIRYRGWEDEYGALVERVMGAFTPDEVVMVSFGTLTFIRPVIRRLRMRQLRSKVLQIPLEETAGKFSYPGAIKLELFRRVYEAFEPWHGKVFFYLCMEDPDLWEPLFGTRYASNAEFEADMKAAYMRKTGGR